MHANCLLSTCRFTIALACASVLGCAPAAPIDKAKAEKADPIGEKVAGSESDQKAPLPTANRPSVVLISIDTLRPDHLGCYGYTRPTSPNIDRLAQDSTKFTNCRSQAPWTLPSHMSLMTSMLPTSNGVDNLSKVLPAQFATLAELLSGSGYTTVGLVNDAQMKSHWGFARGFDQWREFEVDTPEGDCEHITAAAIDWLHGYRDADPFFLFLHYYDPHDPYAAPQEFRTQFHAKLEGHSAREICFAHRRPDANIDDPRLLAELIAAYDAEIAWVDREVGKVLAAIPPDALVILFSDHGEAFEEHGWTLHGATLYEEELRVPLLVRMPGSQRQPATADQPAMLLDVAPTILELCDINPPLQFQGRSLASHKLAEKLDRFIPAESKAVLEGRILLSAVLYPWKGIYGVIDGRFELFKLPDEQTALQESEREMAAALRKPLTDWISGESFWMIHAAGRGEFEATIELATGRFAQFIPVGLEPERDRLEVSDDGRTIQWRAHPGGEGVKSLFFQPADPAAPLQLDFKINGESVPGQVNLGPGGRHPESLPTQVTADTEWVSPAIAAPFSAPGAGFFVLRHQARTGDSPASRVEPLDPATVRRLRSLGYLP